MKFFLIKRLFIGFFLRLFFINSLKFKNKNIVVTTIVINKLIKYYKYNFLLNINIFKIFFFKFLSKSLLIIFFFNLYENIKLWSIFVKIIFFHFKKFFKMKKNYFYKIYLKYISIKYLKFLKKSEWLWKNFFLNYKKAIYYIFIKFTWKNFFISITDYKGRPYIFLNTGKLFYNEKKKARTSIYNINKLAKVCAKIIKLTGIVSPNLELTPKIDFSRIILVLKSTIFMYKIQSWIRTLKKNGISFIEILDKSSKFKNHPRLGKRGRK
jgi:hypothetical protein